MSKHPINMAIRFILEIVMLVVSAVWAWNQEQGNYRYLFVIGLPVLFAALWGIFAVRHDPSRSGKTVIATPGMLRLIIEFSLFGFVCWALFDLGAQTAALIFLLIVFVHYFFSIDRIKWLLKQK
ncbi:DUF2568 domain-containing protein [Maribellus comscasis]|uniref:DUF2568 domain-containing protein n=1 Tax=Maribellus comscasis TaxID=2681766 RepID=A0A6I6JJS2_9BACT|nr:YrdB family protein [Maribellus comscasis]QGY43076.1 DUF2568 domain-containing protein [Maribellus comscasis]